MIYFDNAATGGFKPNCVLETVNTVLKYLSANPGRSGHRLSVTGANIVYDCRKSIAELFSATPERVIFTKNCTEALNLAIFGTLKVGGHIITSVYEHNSILRPLFYLESQNLISLTVVTPSKEESLDKTIEKHITDKTYMVALTCASNVTGEVLPFSLIGKLCKQRGILFLLDGAQGGGHLPISLKNDGVNLLALAGHKGLYGVMGSGALIIDENTQVSPVSFGGTGTQSLLKTQPEELPERLETGTLNLPAIAGLNEGVNFISANLINFSERLISSTAQIINSLKDVGKVTVFSSPNPVGIVAFDIDGYDSSEVCDILDKQYDIAVRGGAHCAPLMHEFLGTNKKGLVRVSLAVQNNGSEINHFLRAVNKIASR